MNTTRQRQIRAVFDAVVSLPPETQAEIVRRKSGGDSEVESSVMRLLEASRSGGKFLENPLAERFDLSSFKGTRLGAYVVDRQIGSGGMGVVYLAVRADDIYKRTAALKIVHPGYNTPDKIERFRRERQILAQLDHPNIARIVDGGTTPTGLPYFVMDYVDGKPIDAFCNERRAGLDQRLNLFRQACAAVQYLHENHVIHRDLKPANMLVTNSGTVKLLDFGIAKLLDPGSQALVTSAAIASPGYASPEQLDGRPAGPASDIYSLGAILYELLTGIRPHEGEERSVPAAIRAVTHDDVRKPSASLGPSATLQTRESIPELRKQLQGDLDSILLMTLRQEPKTRYTSVAELAGDVENFQAGRPVLARKGASLYVVSRFARRNVGGLAAAAVLIAVLSRLGWDEWKLHQLSTRMASIQTASSLIASINTQQGPERIQQSLQQLGENYKTAFPEMLDNPLATKKETETIVNRDLNWLDQVAPLAQQKPQLTPSLVRTYIDVAQAQFSDDHASLKDAEGSLATCKKAFALLKQLPEETLNGDTAKNLKLDLKRQVDMLPGVHE
jgi:eukaryotic-like serine/threonine-protein kinase